MSHITLNLKLTFEQTVGPEDLEPLLEKFQDHLDVLLELGFLDRYGTVYDYNIDIVDYAADDS